MASLTEGDKAPDFKAPSDTGEPLTLSSFLGRKIVLYFYPKDDTPGCTKEACSFQDNLSQLNDLNVTVIGVSKDSVKKHQKFKEKYNLDFPLLSDEDGNICETYGTWVEKNMYGKKYMGIERSTFLINEDGVITHIWRKVKVDGHTDAIKAEL